jgi:hypothetical protein
MAERDATVHAASSLFLQFGLWKVFVELLPVVDPFQRRTICRELSLKLHEAGWITHSYFLADVL